MMLELHRRELTRVATLGELWIPGAQMPVIYTLEDIVRGRDEPKIYGKTAIPAGCYPLVVRDSARFKRRLPLLLGVPGFDGIRIHAGNSAADTDGCILVGLHRGANYVFNSRRAMDVLMPILEAEVGLMHILITDDFARRPS